eukprot:12921737-Prorocentrum_lima.AAC.1
MMMPTCGLMLKRCRARAAQQCAPMDPTCVVCWDLAALDISANNYLTPMTSSPPPSACAAKRCCQ